MVTKQILNSRKMFSLVENRHKKRGFLIRSSHASIHNQKEAKLPNSHKVTFFIFYFLSKFIYLLLKFRVSFIHKSSHYFYKGNLKGKSLIQQIKLT